MADALPTWDEALQNGGKSALPTWDEAVEKHGTSALDTTLNAADALLRFPERAMGERNVQQSAAVDDFFKKTSAGRIMGAFGTGVEHSISQDGRPFGLDEQTEKFLKDSGVFNNYADSQTNLIRSFNEALIKPAAVGVDSAMRALDAGFMGPTGAIAQGAREIGQPALASDIELLPEYLMGGHAAIPHILPPEIAHAKVVGVLDSEAVYMGTKERTPQQVSDAYKAAATLPEDIVAYEAPKPFDIHQTAREIAPETFTKYDALAREKENYRTQLSDMHEERVNTPQIQALDEQISAIEESKKGGYGKKQALIEKRDALLDEAKTDTPEMAEIRRKLQETDYGQRDLAVDVSKAYREAKERSPAEDTVLEEMQEEPVELGAPPTEQQSGLERYDEGAKRLFPEEGPANMTVPDSVLSAFPDMPLRDQAQSERAAAETVPSPRPIEEQLTAIKQDMVKRITAAGRPLEEANAVAELEAARYRTAAEMFEGKRGTAEELYHAESANLRAGKERVQTSDMELAQEPNQKLEIEQRLKTKIDSDFQAAVQEYNAIPESMDGKVINTDLARELSEDYIKDRTQSAAVHEPASKFTKDLYAQKLKEPPRQREEPTVMFTAGGTGAGKSRLVSILDDAFNKAQIIYDTNMNKFDSSKQKIDQALNANKNVHIVYVYRDPVESLVNGALPRAMRQEGEFGTGRTVPLNEHYRTHVGALETMHNLQEYYKDEPRFNISVYHNSPEGIREISLDDIPAMGYSDLKKRLGKNLDEQYKQGKISEKIHQGFRDGWIDDQEGLGGIQETAEKGSISRVKEQESRPHEINELDQRAKGKIRLAEKEAKATITLFKNSDASTLLHEKGHEWTDQILRWAKDLDAPETLRKHAETIRKYVGAEDGAPLTRKQHEKMARSMERYFMEGVAPSRELASVFAKFKKWFTDLYETVQRLRAPINDDIRDVFDRMFTTTPEKTVLAPDSEPGKMIADHHEYDAANTPPERAAEVRTQIRQEADRTAQQHDEELYGELTRPSDGQPAETAAPPGTISAGEPTAASVPTETPDQIRQRGIEAVTDGLRLSEQDTKPDTDGKFPDSPNAPFRRPESELVDKAGNIRLDNLNTPEDVNQVLRDIASENQDFMPARRGVISVTEQMDLADALGMDSTKLNMRKIGEAFNAEQIIAARKLLIQSATGLRELATKAANGSEADLMAYAEAKARHTMVQDQVSGVTAEAGRALAAFRSLEGSKEAKLVGDFLQKQTGKDLFQLQAEAKMLSEMDTTAQVSKFVKDSQKPTFMDMVLEFRTAALLWGPKTHVKNALGNMITMVNSIAETGVAAGIGKIREAIAGAPVERVYASEVRARMFGAAQGAKDGAKLFAHAIQDENFQFGNSQIETNRVHAIPGKAGEAIRGSFRALNASDAFSKALAYRQELNAIAYRIAEKEGLAGDDFNRRVTEVVQDPSESIMKQAMEYAEYQTYQNKLGPVGQSFVNTVNKSKVLQIIFPFKKTPINITKYAGERTPLGLFSSEVRDNLSGKNGDIARDTQAARLVWGTALIGAAYTMAMEGQITGGGPSDRKERAAWSLAGNQEYSVKVGDGWYSYGWAEPLSTIWGTAASMAELQKNGKMDEESADKLPLLLLGSINKNIISKSFLRGGNEAAQMLLDPDRYAEKWGQNFVASFVPNLLSQQASAGDEYQREIHTTLDAIKNKIPGQRETLLPRRDIWGEPMSSGDSLGPDILSPIYENRLTQDPVNKALGKLGWAPDKPQRKIMGVELNDKQYDDYARTAGRMAKMRLNPVVGNPGFGNLPQKAQLDIIQKTISQSREMARKLIMMQNPEIMRQAIENKRKDARGGK